jgi:hypothetical protein
LKVIVVRKLRKNAVAKKDFLASKSVVTNSLMH